MKYSNVALHPGPISWCSSTSKLCCKESDPMTNHSPSTHALSHEKPMCALPSCPLICTPQSETCGIPYFLLYSPVIPTSKTSHLLDSGVYLLALPYLPCHTLKFWGDYPACASTDKITPLKWSIWQGLPSPDISLPSHHQKPSLQLKAALSWANLFLWNSSMEFIPLGSMVHNSTCQYPSNSRSLLKADLRLIDVFSSWTIIWTLKSLNVWSGKLTKWCSMPHLPLFLLVITDL